MTRLAIVQPYVPDYRVPFFEGLRSALVNDGVQVTVIAGAPEGSQAARGDRASRPWITYYDQRRIRVGARSLGVGTTRRHWAGSDAVILPLMGSSLDPYLALFRRDLRVGLWGHVGSYVADENRVDAALEGWMVRRAHHIFAYTDSGARRAVTWGADRLKVTTVMNTIDTSSLRDNLAKIREKSSAFDVIQHPPSPVVLAFIGGLDSSKRIRFLAEALEHLRNWGTDVLVLIGGLGDEAHELDGAVAAGQVRMLGRVAGWEKAKLLSMSSAIVSPGRIGLLAVDALASGIPVLTTRWRYHAPEIEYLEEGVSMFSSDDDPAEYAALVQRFVASPLKPQPFNFPTLEAMVENFRRGVHHLLAG